MAYIGKSPIIGNFVKLDAITAVNGQAAYTMKNGGSAFTDYESVNQFLVSLNGTIQAPTDSFTVSGSTLTFASNLSTGDVIDFVMCFGNSLSAGVPTDATVTTAKLADDAVTNAKLSFNANQYRNIIINGDMSIAQRATSASSISSSGYQTVDRFINEMDAAGTWTISQSTTVPSGQGFATSLKMDCTTANGSLSAGSYNIFSQRLEGQNLQYLKFGTSSAESLTLSFWVRSNKTGTYTLEINSFATNKSQSQTYTILSADTWEKKTVTFTGDTATAIANDNARSLNLMFWLAAGTTYTSGTLNTSFNTKTDANRVSSSQVNLADSTSNEWYITGVQLEVGTAASDFEFLPVDANLGRCQRYFEKSYQMADAPGTSGSGGSYGLQFGGATANIDATIIMSTRKRATPTLTVYDLAGTSNKASYYTGSWNNGGSLFSRGRETYVHVDTNISSSSIVAWHFTADAEL